MEESHAEEHDDGNESQIEEEMSDAQRESGSQVEHREDQQNGEHGETARLESSQAK